MTNREIDALVAEKVMGWQKEPMHLADDEGNSLVRWFGPNRQLHLGLLPEFSTDIAVAWLVVEKMRDHCFTLTRERICSDRPIDGYYAVIGATGQWAETAPRAICLAVLKAKGVEVAP